MRTQHPTPKALHCRLGVTLLVAALATAPAAHGMDLLESYRLALHNDAQFQVSKADNRARQEVLSQATAQLLPNVSANGFRAKASTDTRRDRFSGHDDYYSSSYALKLTQPIYRKYNFAQYAGAKAQVRSADASLDSDRQDLVRRLAEAYFNALLAGEQLALVLAQKDAYAAQLEAAEHALRAGVGTRTDIDDARARYDLIVAQELEARQNTEFTRRELQVLVDRPVEDLAALVPARMTLQPPTPTGLEEWFTRGEETNPELRALRANIDAAQQEVEKARAGHYPTLDLFAQRSKSQSESNTSINTRYFTNQVGIQFNLPLFAGGYVNSQVRQAAANLDKFRDQYEARRREVRLNIRKEFQNVAEGVLKVKALEQAERSAEQAVYSNSKGFEAGTRTRLDILNAEQQRMNTRRDLAKARYDYIVARIRLFSLAGGTGEEELAAVNAWLSEASPESPAMPQ